MRVRLGISLLTFGQRMVGQADCSSRERLMQGSFVKREVDKPLILDIQDALMYVSSLSVQTTAL